MSSLRFVAAMLILLAGLLTAGCGGEAEEVASLTPAAIEQATELERVYRQYAAAWDAQDLAALAATLADDFVFNVKAFGLLTHHPARVDRLPGWLREALPEEARGKANAYAKDIPGDDMERLWQLHRVALEPLAAAGKLGAVLFQFPPWFVRSRDHADYLRALPDRLPGWPLAVEFRGGGWMEEDAAAHTFGLLEEAGLAYVCVDEPQGFASRTAAVVAATSPLAVVRLHGRNADTWDATTRAASDRFKYLYADAELEEWVPRVRELARQTQTVHVLFNNNYEDWGMQNARRMARLLHVETRPPQGQLELD